MSVEANILMSIWLGFLARRRLGGRDGGWGQAKRKGTVPTNDQSKACPKDHTQQGAAMLQKKVRRRKSGESGESGESVDSFWHHRKRNRQEESSSVGQNF